MKRLPIGLILLLPVVLHAQPVTHHPQPDQALSAKWPWAEEQATQRSGYWIGYSIERLMDEGSFMGSWSSNERRPSLMEVLYNRKPVIDPFNNRQAARTGPDRQVLKDVVLLFYFDEGSSAPSEIHVSNLEGRVDLEGRPLYWLGGASDNESMMHVERLYDQARSADTREKLVFAIAIHENTEAVVERLSAILRSDAADDIREQAAFWLGQQADPTALDVLIRTARTDRSGEVREQAVFGISQTELPAATEALIDLAYHAEGKVREQAIFWLGQEASTRAVEALGDIVEDGPDTEVQKQAVFALSQLPADEAVPLLIKIAKTHPKSAVRKQAIFWLGQSEDPRALDALVELVRG